MPHRYSAWRLRIDGASSILAAKLSAVVHFAKDRCFERRHEMRKCNRLSAVVLAATLAMAAPYVAHSQQKFPTKPIRILVPFAAGSQTDILARVIGQKMTENWGQQVVVDNRPGAGGIVASQV